MKGILDINPIGGLANRMRAVASSVQLALYLGVDFRVIWLRNWELNARYEDIFMMPDMLEDKIEYPGALEYYLNYSNPRKRNLWLSALAWRRYGSVFSSLRPKDVRYLQLSSAFSGGNPQSAFYDTFHKAFEAGKDTKPTKCLIQSGIEVFPYSHALYRELFRPAKDIAAGSGERLGQLGTQAYGIHIRRTDNAMSIQNSPDELFIREMNSISDREPEARFYLATDSEEVKHRFKDIFGDRIMTSNKPADRNSVEGIKEAATELYTLAGTCGILGSHYSSFSEAAAIIGNVPIRQLVQKKQPER